MSTTGTNAYIVTNLLEKMNNQDRDFRYMALNDLMNELQKDTFILESSIESKVVKGVLQLLNDKNSEVQNLAVKCLGPLVKQIREEQLFELIDRLDEYTTQTASEELRGIASVSLKTVIAEINQHQGGRVCARIIPKLLRNIQSENATYEMEMDTLDILAEILTRFGTQISLENQAEIQNALLFSLNHQRPAIRKRATVAIGYLVIHTNDSLFHQLVTYLLEGLQSNTQAGDKQRTFVQCAGVLSRYSAVRLGKQLNAFVPIIIACTKKSDDDDELREICLQALESFVYRCPTEASPFVNEIIQLALEYIKYDPNFAGGDDDEDEFEAEDEDMDADEDDEFDDIAGYSDDDDDMSWKVRRSSSKLLCAIIETRLDMLQQMYELVAPVLISRFKEREDTVRIDVLQTFIALLRQTNASEKSGEGYETANKAGSLNLDGISLLPVKCASNDTTETDEIKKTLSFHVPKLCRALAKQAESKSTETRQVCFQLLRELVVVLRGGLETQMELFIPIISSSLSSTLTDQHQMASSSNIKIEALSFLGVFFRKHAPEAIHLYCSKLFSLIMQSFADKYYKITSEAFLVCMEFIKAVRPIYYIPESKQYDIRDIDQDHVPFIKQIYATVLQVLGTSDADQEVKEKSIVCLGVLLVQVGDILQSEQQEAFNVLLERLRNEVTRLISIRTLAVIAQSPIVVGDEFQKCVVTAVDEVTLLLRKNNRSLRIASLECLCVLISRHGECVQEKSLRNLLNEVRPLVSDTDLHLLPLALKTVEAILAKHPESINNVKAYILPTLFQLIQSPLLQGSSLNSLLNLLAALAKASPSDYQYFVKGLVDPLLAAKKSNVQAGSASAVTNKQAASTVAQCVAVLAANTNESNRNETITNFQSYILDPSANESVKYLSLLTLGELGRRINLSEFNNIDQQVIDLFGAQSEEVKFAAAFALGNICVGNIPKYLPMIVSQIKDQPKKRYLLLHALKEIIARYSETSISLKDDADQIWALLLENSQAEQEEGTRTVVAECLGKLALSEPSKFLPQLEENMSSSSVQLRAAVTTAVKYAVVDPSVEYTQYLKPIISKFLQLLEDTDLNVRRLTLLTINSAALRKPYLIRDVLPNLIPLLFQETVVREELIHTVEMGPFKHKVDDGLEIRKAAYECLYTLLSNSLDKIDTHSFLERVTAGLTDQHDIRMLAYLMLIRLSKVAPTTVIQKLDDLVDPLKVTLDFKMRSNAVKQEVEKNQELIRADLRCIYALSPLCDGSVSPRFYQFINEVKTGPLATEFRSIADEAESREYRVSDYMDLS
ncbi:Cullin-associated NEDD8-dissociated protein 1 [Rhizopus azygosporus]|uniref:Cullin-associated NEDD8-dissociated protein 1 n=1 Tax=Rhizopus azygosporus TaxID=86630 RepID=A0A367K427_RHIAZ|nr:Cullin-associated NEDD8-dissociated protein 1 [Rhizopus azygosporus]